MTQDVFCSVYTKDYTWWDNVERPAPAKGINIAYDPEKDVKFLSPDDLKPGKESPAAIRQLHQLWWNSTYRVDFCEQREPGGPGTGGEVTDPLKDDELMDSMERALNPVPRKLLPPPDTSRVVYGFCPLRRFRAGRSFYADVHSRPAFEKLKRTILERGMGRLAAAPRHYPEPDYSTPPCHKYTKQPPPTWIHLQPEPRV